MSSICVTIQQKKQANPAGGDPVVIYLVKAMAIQRPDGSKTLIPNPSGADVAVFDTLDAAEQAVRRAGFDSEFDGQRRINLHQSSERLTGTSHTVVSRGGREQDWMSAMRATLPVLLKRLNDRESSVITQSALAVGELHLLEALPQVSQSVIPLLLKHLGHEDPLLRKAIADTLAKLGLDVLDPLRQAYAQARISTAQNASHIRLTVLGSYAELLRHYPNGIAKVLEVALEALEDDHWLVRAQAAQLVAQAALLLRTSTTVKNS
jgi:HEAT repeat protein